MSSWITALECHVSIADRLRKQNEDDGAELLKPQSSYGPLTALTLTTLLHVGHVIKKQCLEVSH